jgi:RNA polymerase sigma factor (sigma-70 family)
MSAEPQSGSASWLAMLMPYITRLQRYLSRRLPSAHDVDDVSQQIWERLLKSDPAAVRDPLALLFVVARNVVADFFDRRTNERKLVVTDSDELERIAQIFADPATPNPEERLIDQREVEYALAQLPTLQAQVLRLQMEGLSYEEIAIRLGISVFTVEKYLVKAKACLRTILIK